MHRLLLPIVLSGLALIAGSSIAQTYPDRPIRAIVAYPPGGAFDNIARLVGPHIAKELGQSIVIDNRPGATGQLGTALVARAAADGYTLLFGGIAALTIVPHLAKTQYDPLKDFVPISLLAVNDSLIVVNPSFPAQDLKEFIELLKRSPGKYSFASGGIGSVTHVAGELFKARAGVDMVHVPYKGDGPAIIDLMGGTVPIMVTSLATAEPHVKSGRVRPIASLGSTRFPQLPNVPALAESGFAGLVASSWLGLYAPAGTAPEVISKLNSAAKAALQNKDLIERLAAQGSKAISTSPDEFAAFTRDEHAKWGKVIRDNGITAE